MINESGFIKSQSLKLEKSQVLSNWQELDDYTFNEILNPINPNIMISVNQFILCKTVNQLHQLEIHPAIYEAYRSYPWDLVQFFYDPETFEEKKKDYLSKGYAIRELNRERMIENKRKSVEELKEKVRLESL
ncbi:hypothetical protein [Peijinzhouia sedimentorum]